MLSEIFAAFDRPDTPGAAAAVLHRGRLVGTAAFGSADLAAGRACTPTTNFRLASVTKQLTAMAVLLLGEAGRLSLDDPAGRWLPGLPGYARAVTIRQLLTHTSGLADYEDRIPGERTLQVRDSEIPDMLPPEAAAGAYFAPGARYRYSNTGYVLLALLAERAADQGFPELLRDLIFAPLDMRATLAYQPEGPPIAERAYGHSYVGEGWQRTDQSVTSATLGDGGVYSSAEDMARWLAALDTGAIGRPATLQAAWAPSVATDDGRQYGFGWVIGSHRGGTLIHHDGTTAGFRTAVVRLPERQLSAVVLANRSAADPTALALALLDES
jgi:CubicO group peptidase (beta-lactamase class C family)